jgi:hypothetical protein
MKERFDRKDGKVIYIVVEPVTFNYPEGTHKVEVIIYPVGVGSYSSFIYTSENLSSIKSALPKIAALFLNDDSIYGSGSISDGISLYLEPIFPKKT